MRTPTITAGQSYRLRRDFEVHDEKTGTLKHFLTKGTILKVKKAAPDEGHVWIEGVPLPLPIDALVRAIDPVQ